MTGQRRNTCLGTLRRLRANLVWRPWTVPRKDTISLMSMGTLPVDRQRTLRSRSAKPTRWRRRGTVLVDSVKHWRHVFVLSSGDSVVGAEALPGSVRRGSVGHGGFPNAIPGRSNGNGGTFWWRSAPKIRNQTVLDGHQICA